MGIDAQMRPWQPIETAPKDGTRIDLWLVDQDGDGERVTDAYWVTNAHWVPRFLNEDGSKPSASKRDGWFAPYHDYEMDGWCDNPPEFNHHPRHKRVWFTKATHWMPLPEPPDVE